MAPWTEEEIEILKEFYPKEGTKVIKRLPGKSAYRINRMAKEMSLSIEGYYGSWTDEEIEILKKYYPKEGSNVARRLPNKRSRPNISMKARELSLKYQGKHGYSQWTPEEVSILEEYYPVEGVRVSARIPNHTASSIRSKVKEMGLRCIHIKKPEKPKTRFTVKWNKEEDEILKKYYPSEGTGVIKRLPDRTIPSIKHRAGFLKLSSDKYVLWTEEDTDILKKYYPKEGLKVAKRLPNHTVAAILSRAGILGLKRESRHL